MGLKVLQAVKGLKGLKGVKGVKGPKGKTEYYTSNTDTACIHMRHDVYTSSSYYFKTHISIEK